MSENVTSITFDGHLLQKLYAVPTEFVAFSPEAETGIIERTFRVVNSGMFGASGVKDSVDVFRHVYAGKPLPISCGIFRTRDVITVVKEATEYGVGPLEPFLWLRICEKHPHCTVENEQHKLTPAKIEPYGPAIEYFSRSRGDHYVPYTVILHLYSHYETANAETKRRNQFAETTWEPHHESGKMIDVRIEDSLLTRSSKHVGDTVAIPYVHDLIDAGLQRAQQQDIILFTNRDTCMSTELADRIHSKMESVDACFSYRRDFRRLTLHIEPARIRFGMFYPGCDLFGFRPCWWAHYRELMPDMLLGYEAWDRVMRELVSKSHLAQDPSFTDLIYHESHPNVWEHPKNRKAHPCQIHNRQLARSFLLRRLIPLDELS
jgi:hypothetical protein